jgi:hypothetical protein
MVGKFIVLRPPVPGSTPLRTHSSQAHSLHTEPGCEAGIWATNAVPAVVRSGSISNSSGNSPMPRIPFSGCNMRLTSVGIDLSTRVGLPIPAVTLAVAARVRTRADPEIFETSLHGTSKKDPLHDCFNLGSHLFRGNVIRRLQSAARGPEDGPGGRCSQQGGIDTGLRRMMHSAFEEHKRGLLTKKPLG